MSISIEPNKGLRLKLDRFSPIRTWHGGGNLWAHEFQSTVRQGSLALFLPKAVEEDDSVLFELRVGGVEVASISTQISSIAEIPTNQLEALRAAVTELKNKAEDPHCDRTKRQIIQGFRLPDPQTDRDLYRLVGSKGDQKLIVLWGVEREEGSALDPITAVDLLHTPAALPAASLPERKSKLVPALFAAGVTAAALAAGGTYFGLFSKPEEHGKKDNVSDIAAKASADSPPNLNSRTVDSSTISASSLSAQSGSLAQSSSGTLKNPTQPSTQGSAALAGTAKVSPLTGTGSLASGTAKTAEGSVVKGNIASNGTAGTFAVTGSLASSGSNNTSGSLNAQGSAKTTSATTSGSVTASGSSSSTSKPQPSTASASGADSKAGAVTGSAATTSGGSSTTAASGSSRASGTSSSTSTGTGSASGTSASSGTSGVNAKASGAPTGSISTAGSSSSLGAGVSNGTGSSALGGAVTGINNSQKALTKQRNGARQVDSNSATNIASNSTSMPLATAVAPAPALPEATVMTPNGPPPAGISSLTIVSTSLSKLLTDGKVEVLLNIVSRTDKGIVGDAPPISEWRVDGVVQSRPDGKIAEGPVLPVMISPGKHTITTIGRGADGNPYRTDADVLIRPQE